MKISNELKNQNIPAPLFTRSIKHRSSGCGTKDVYKQKIVSIMLINKGQNITVMSI